MFIRKPKRNGKFVPLDLNALPSIAPVQKRVTTGTTIQPLFLPLVDFNMLPQNNTQKEQPKIHGPIVSELPQPQENPEENLPQMQTQDKDKKNKVKPKLEVVSEPEQDASANDQTKIPERKTVYLNEHNKKILENYQKFIKNYGEEYKSQADVLDAFLHRNHTIDKKVQKYPISEFKNNRDYGITCTQLTQLVNYFPYEWNLIRAILTQMNSSSMLLIAVIPVTIEYPNQAQHMHTNSEEWWKKNKNLMYKLLFEGRRPSMIEQCKVIRESMWNEQEMGEEIDKILNDDKKILEFEINFHYMPIWYAQKRFFEYYKELKEDLNKGKIECNSGTYGIHIVKVVCGHSKNLEKSMRRRFCEIFESEGYDFAYHVMDGAFLIKTKIEY